jgi:glycosyltransferase involved in cell wall biosynthesis
MVKLSQPLVSIGVPVYNGENGLANALNSLLGQSYTNFEIIISDNCSTDRTPLICQEFTTKDSRISYSRNEKNIGAIGNFNRLVRLASGKYFMWAAHDDLREQSFITECVNKLEANPCAVLCQTHTSLYVVGRDEMLCVFTLDSIQEKTKLGQRYNSVLKNCPAVAIYGIYNLEKMRKTNLLQNSIASDVAFLQELSIHGTFEQVQNILFKYIVREKWNTVQQDYKACFGNQKPFWYLPFIVLFYSHLKRLILAPISFNKKIHLILILFANEINQFFLKIMIKILGRFCPKRWLNIVGTKIYWSWMHNTNVKVCCENLYFERVIMPRLGWWK